MGSSGNDTLQLSVPAQGVSAGPLGRVGGAVHLLHCHGRGMAPGTPADKENVRGAGRAPVIVGLSSVNQSILKVILCFLSPGRVMSMAPFQSRWGRRKGGGRGELKYLNTPFEHYTERFLLSSLPLLVEY